MPYRLKQSFPTLAFLHIVALVAVGFVPDASLVYATRNGLSLPCVLAYSVHLRLSSGFFSSWPLDCWPCTLERLTDWLALWPVCRGVVVVSMY